VWGFGCGGGVGGGGGGGGGKGGSFSPKEASFPPKEITTKIKLWAKADSWHANNVMAPHANDGTTEKEAIDHVYDT